MKNKKLFIGILVAVVVVLASFLIRNRSNEPSKENARNVKVAFWQNYYPYN